MLKFLQKFRCGCIQAMSTTDASAQYVVNNYKTGFTSRNDDLLREYQKYAILSHFDLKMLEILHWSGTQCSQMSTDTIARLRKTLRPFPSA